MKTLLKIIITAFAAVGIIAVGFTGWVMYDLRNETAIVESVPAYTGEDILNAVNQHRHNIGVNEVVIDSPLCSNLVERWLSIKQPGNGHQGWQEWMVANNLKKDGELIYYSGVAELYTFAETPDEAIQNFLQSPGHKDALENPKAKYACTYSQDGLSVIEMATSHIAND